MHPAPQRLHGEHAHSVCGQQVVDLGHVVHWHAEVLGVSSTRRRRQDRQLDRGVARLTHGELWVAV